MLDADDGRPDKERQHSVEEQQVEEPGIPSPTDAPVSQHLIDQALDARQPVLDRRKRPALPPERYAPTDTVQAYDEADKREQVENGLARAGDMVKDRARGHGVTASVSVAATRHGDPRPSRNRRPRKSVHPDRC